MCCLCQRAAVQHMATRTSSTRGCVHGLQTAARREGLYSLWKGLLPRLLTKAFGSVIWYTTYMEARRWYTREPHAAGARTTQIR